MKTTRHLKAISLIAASVLASNFRCKQEVEPLLPEQVFEVPVKLYPARKTYSLADTIWLETDVPDKFLLDTKTGQKVKVDSAQLPLRATLNRFGTQITNPPGGFADVITTSGVNTNRELGHWATTGFLDAFGCGQLNYRARIGFRLTVQGTYAFALWTDQHELLGTCPGRVAPYYAFLNYRFQNADRNLDLLNSLTSINGISKESIAYYQKEVQQGRAFVVKVK